MWTQDSLSIRRGTRVKAKCSWVPKAHLFRLIKNPLKKSPAIRRRNVRKLISATFLQIFCYLYPSLKASFQPSGGISAKPRPFKRQGYLTHEDLISKPLFEKSSPLMLFAFISYLKWSTRCYPHLRRCASEEMFVTCWGSFTCVKGRSKLLSLTGRWYLLISIPLTFILGDPGAFKGDEKKKSRPNSRPARV